MDKYEFNIKVEQIKKLVTKGDFETAMKIADTIDWRRVRNANLLSMISQVYEKNEEYQEAKEVLLLAFERAPIGKRLIYKLTELALKEGSVNEAEDYYREFCDMAPDDPRQNILRYLILKEKQAPLDQLIHSLERYTNTELDEKWMYELAELYAEAGQEDACIRMCDKLMLMFGLGKYVDRAMELKQQFAPLNSYQMDLVENRDKYEEKLRAVAQEYGDLDSVQEEYEDRNRVGAIDRQPAEEVREWPEPTEEAEALEATSIVEETADEASQDSDVIVEEETAAEEPETAATGRTLDEELIANMQQAAAERELAESMSKISTEDYVEQEQSLGQTKVYGEIYSKPAEKADGEIGSQEETDEEAAVAPNMLNHLMIEARTPERGFQMAVDALKKLHQQTGDNRQVIKITGSKLSRRGIFNVADKLVGKDLIIEEAGDLNAHDLEELRQLLERDETGIVVVLIDNPRQLEELHQQNPGLSSLFECIGAEEEKIEDTIEEAVQKQVELEEKLAREAIPADESYKAAEPKEPSEKEEAAEEESADEPADDEEMDLDEFADYAVKYASKIDCSITGKSMLALYERIEIMEEDGIPLTKANAEDLIEEAADKAEKPSLGHLIKGVFSSKYDKDGLLILKEEHFI